MIDRGAQLPEGIGSMKSLTLTTAAFGGRNRVPLLVTLAAFFIFAPFVFLRYEFHDSWAWLYWLNSLRVFNFVTPCLHLGGHHEMMGKPLLTATLCGMTVFGPVIDRVWIPKLFALLTLFGSGALLLSVFRRAGVNTGLASLALLSLLLLPGMVLMIVWMATNGNAYAVFASILAGYVWLRYLRHVNRTFVTRLALSICVFLLLVTAMFTYPVVAVLFFVPLLIEILFSRQEEDFRQLLQPLLAAGTFALASVSYVVAHRILLLDYHYFFLSDQQVQLALQGDRNIALIGGIGDLGEKFAFLVNTLLPRILSLWFISENATVSPIAAAIFAGVSAVSAALFVWRGANIWRILALLFVAGCFFGPFLVSRNLGNGLYLLERTKVFMQVPFVLLAWWLIHYFLARRHRLGALAATGLLGAAIFVGATVSWLVILRARVIPNYMELVHFEYRLKEAVRQNMREIYIIKADDRHLRATLGKRGSEEIGRITSFYFPQQLVSAVLLEIEGKEIPRAVIPVDADKGDAITPRPGRMIIDMRKFP